MKRRNFLQGLAAGAGVTALPLPAFAKVAATTTKVMPFHYGWACVYAQMNNGVSAADIARVFRISPQEASGLMNRMLTRGVIHAPGLNGRAHPTRAWQPWDKRAPVPSAKASEQSDTTAEHATVQDLFRTMMAHVTGDASFGWTV